MALTELQLPVGTVTEAEATKKTFYAGVQTIADEVYRMMERWEAVSAFLDSMATADLDALDVSATDGVRLDLVDFSNVLKDFVNYWGNIAVTPAKNPKVVIDELRHMNVI